MTERESSSRVRSVVRIVVSVFVSVALLAGAGGASYAIFSSEPTAEREGATRASAALVEVVRVERGDFRPKIEVLGVVRPAREVALSALVGGQVISIADEFTPGRRLPAGTELVRIDPLDYEQALVTRRSERRQVEAEVAIERGRQELAREEYELLDDVVDDEYRSLVLREPQIASLEARLEAAFAAERRAEADVARTRVSVPFDAMVMSRDVDSGSSVGPGDVLGRLVGTGEYWIYARVPVRALRWLELDSDTGGGARVIARHSAWGPDESRLARASRLIGGVDERSRLARVLVRLEDPLATQADGPVVLLDSVLRLEIEGREIEDVVRLSRRHLRRDDTTWVAADGKLEIRKLDVVFRDAEYAYVRTGLADGETVVTTTLATVSEGLPLRLVGEGDEAAGGS